MGDIQFSRFPEPFNQREVDILGLIKQGLSNQEIAHKLFLSLATVKWYNHNIFNKLGVNNRTQAIEKAQEYGLIEQIAIPSISTTLRLKHNLPARPNSFIGRKQELTSLRRLFQTKDIRLVTILGPNGVGKTRLSLELAHQLTPNFRDGAYFVSLAPLNDFALVASAIAHTFGIRETSGHTLQDTLADSLREWQLLLLLDNFEHVLPAALLVSELLAAAPGLKILATSRAPLRVYGEQLFPLSPLSVPDPQNQPSHENLLRFDGARLFVERARAVRPDFDLSASNAPHIVKICQRLDGLPLAIELAAARARTLSPAVMAAQFDGREGRFPFQMLAQGARDAPARHQTLHNAIAWSYDLLEVEAQALFRRLGVFAGGCTQDAVEAVCQGSLAALESLVDMNLLIQSEVEGAPRFEMLEMIRAYALEQLDRCGERDLIRQGHADYYLALVETFSSKFNSLNGLVLLDRLKWERNNLRNVLTWSLLESSQHPLPQRIRIVLTWLEAMHLPSGEDRQWIEKALSRLAEYPGASVDREMLMLQADLRVLDGWKVYTEGDYPAARDIWKQALSFTRRLDDKFRLSNVLVGLSWTLVTLGHHRQAKVTAEQALSLGRQIENAWAIGQGLNILGCLELLHGNHDRAESLYAESLDCFKQAQNPSWEAVMLLNIGQSVQDRDDQARARELYLEALSRCWKLVDVWGIGLSLEKVACSAAAYRQYRKAARLFAAAQKLHQSIGYMLEIVERLGHEKYLPLVQHGLSPAEFAAAWAEGQALTLEQAVAEALGNGAV
jgi:predicted ATPase/DNA-binding CsgD family transcriptional regulator